MTHCMNELVLVFQKKGTQHRKREWGDNETRTRWKTLAPTQTQQGAGIHLVMWAPISKQDSDQTSPQRASILTSQGLIQINAIPYSLPHPLAHLCASCSERKHSQRLSFHMAMHRAEIQNTNMLSFIFLFRSGSEFLHRWTWLSPPKQRSSIYVHI